MSRVFSCLFILTIDRREVVCSQWIYKTLSKRKEKEDEDENEKKPQSNKDCYTVYRRTFSWPSTYRVLSCPFPKVHHVHVSALTTCALYHCLLDFSDKLQRRSSHAINRHPTKSPMPCIVKRQSGLDMLGGTSSRSKTSSIALHPLPHNIQCSPPSTASSHEN